MATCGVLVMRMDVEMESDTDERDVCLGSSLLASFPLLWFFRCSRVEWGKREQEREVVR